LTTQATKKTDNSYTADKIALRINYLPVKDELNILDCFGGHGVIWKAIQRKYNKKINRVAIDSRNDLLDFHLHGDNIKILSGMNLDKFDVIDLDSYGIPYNQLKIVFDKKFKGIVFVTAIYSKMGGVHKDMLIDIGFTREMMKKSKTIYGARGFEYFLEWLALNGIKRIVHRSKARKHYLMFDTEDVLTDCNSLQVDKLEGLS